MDTALKAELPMFVSLGDRSVPFFLKKDLARKVVKYPLATPSNNVSITLYLIA